LVLWQKNRISRLGGRFVAIAQRLDLVMISTCALVLPTNDLLDVGRQIFFKSFAVTIDSDVFSALTLVQHRLIIVKGNRPARCDPTTMHCA
jgi:hypothetical protein